MVKSAERQFEFYSLKASYDNKHYIYNVKLHTTSDSHLKSVIILITYLLSWFEFHFQHLMGTLFKVQTRLYG